MRSLVSQEFHKLPPIGLAGSNPASATIFEMPYKNIEARRKSQREYYKRQYTLNREACLNLLGGICVKCKFTDKRALNVDHVNGGGGKEAKSFGGSYYKKIRTKIEGGSTDYQVLCANCNQIKRHENDE